MQDGPYTPAAPDLFPNGIPVPMDGDAPPPLAIRDADRRVKPNPKFKKPIRVAPPSKKDPIIILDPPPRKKPRKADEILEILANITDSEPKRAKRAIAKLPIPTRNRLCIVPAVGN